MPNVRPALFLALAAILTGSAIAQGPGGPQPRPVLQALDTDHDGNLSAAEIANAPAVLKSLDADHDGQLNSLEFLPKQVDPKAADPEGLVTRLMVLDRNGDGVLTADEIPERLQNLLQKADTNHDGKLTPDELSAYAKTQSQPVGRPVREGQATRMDPILNALDADHDGIISAAEIANAPTALLTLDKNGDGQLTADEFRPRQQGPEDRARHMIDEWDTNKDGKIAKEEAPDRVQEQFATIDTNGDGFLDITELTVYFQKMPAQRPRGEGVQSPGGGQGSSAPRQQ